ncbi:MAG: hypothetical protein U0232_08165 [Thermomicrobiales bacterium]
MGGPLAGGLGAFAFYTTVMALSQTAYLDFFTTLFAVAPMAILLARRRPDWRVAILAGVCLGFGVATKLHFGYVAVGSCATLGLLALRQGGLPRACWLCAT